MRKVYVELKVKLVINVNEDVLIADVIDNLDYGFISQIDKAEIEDTEILDYEIQDSK